MSERVDLLKKSREHWENMHTWVRTQPAGDNVNVDIMEGAIGELWGASHCPLCKRFLHYKKGKSVWEEGIDICNSCPLAQIRGSCNDPYSTWQKVNHAKTWEEWLIASDGMIKVLDEAIEREEAV